jgi:hypothetical protein
VGSRRPHAVILFSIAGTRARRSAFQRAVLVFSLLVSLAANPVVAFVHAWEHVHEHSEHPGKALHHGGHVCELCAAYAAIGHAMPASGLFVATAEAERPALPVPRGETITPRFFSSYRQRAPPLRSPPS